MKKMFLLLMLFLLAGCASQTSRSDDSGDGVTTEYPAPGFEDVEEAVVEPDGEAAEGETREFILRASQWDFEPAVIEVNEGDRVLLKIKSEDVEHGIAIQEFDVNVKLPAGEETEVEFVADKKGEFRFYCSVFCGEGHKQMEGKLIVK